MTYSVIFQGSIKPGVSPEQARASLAQLFNLPDSTRVERYFTGATLVIKSGLDSTQAEKYRQLLDSAGLLADVRDDSPSSILDIPAPRKTDDGLIQTAAPALLALEPLAPIAPAAAPPPVVPPSQSPPAPAGEPAAAVARMWWLMLGSEKLGPYSREELQAMAGAGKLTADSRLWKTGLKEPVAASSLSWLNLQDPVVMAMLRPPPAPTAQVPDTANQAADALLAATAAHKPESSTLPILVLLVLLPLNFMVGKAGAPGADEAGAIGYGAGMALFWPLLLAWLWPGQRELAGKLRIMMYTSIGITVIMFAHASMKLGQGQHGNAGGVDLSMASSMINHTLPRMVDKNLRLDSTSVVNNTFTYNYTVMTGDVPELTAAKRAKLIEDGCGNPVMQKQLRRGISYGYNYSDHEGKLMVSTVLTPADCGLSQPE